MKQNKILFIIAAIIILGIATILLLNTKAKNTLPAMPALPNQQTIITVTQKGFTPNVVTIKSGTRVIWVNNSNTDVSINSDTKPVAYPLLNLGSFSANSSVQLVFNKPGKYTYHNELNTKQTGTVVVQ